ncbi:threonylcarbamoyl-AMP synthase [Candidatus Roizmanbacteria bacterium]|nr:threonylcarbamoyl-AMP synthase [Candidatus Roizmanbacteria bacterium]
MNMKVVPKQTISIPEVVDILHRGGVVVAPTDTVYGLLCDAKNEIAVKKLIAIKNRPAGKPISVFVSDFDMLNAYGVLNVQQSSVLKTILPGRYTIVLDSKHKNSSLLESEKGTLGFRFIDNAFITELVKQFGSPLTATSANLSGSEPHYSIKTLLSDLRSKTELIDLVVDAGDLPHNKPSTVLDLTTPTVQTIRGGDLLWKEDVALISHSEEETQMIARLQMGSILDSVQKKPVVFILEGELGVGKTVFVKAIAESLEIPRVVSPTYVIYYEYDVSGHPFIQYLIHFDLFSLEEDEEFKVLQIDRMLKPGNVLCFEWGEKAGPVFEMLKEKAEIVFIHMKYTGKGEREIAIRRKK